MKPGGRLLTVILALAMGVSVPIGTELTATADEEEPSFSSTRVNLGFTYSIPSNLTQRLHTAKGTLLETVDAINMVVIEPASGQTQSGLIAAMQTYSDTEYAVPDLRGTLAFVPNDYYYDNHNPSQDYYLDYLNVEDGWDDELGSRSILVAVIDTGTFCAHPDFKVDLTQTICVTGSDTVDPLGHGTEVTGVLAAVMNNDVGIAGLAQVNVLALSRGAELLLSNTVIAILRAIDLDARIINLSGTVGIDCEESDAYRWICKPLKDAVDAATEAGILFVAAVGNEAHGCPDSQGGVIGFPAAYDDVLAVGASSGDGRWWLDATNGSNCGPEIDVLAPGGCCMITTSTPAHYSDCQNQMFYCVLPYGMTSLATPHVAGAAALMLSKCPDLTRAELKETIEETATNLSLPWNEQGNGRLDVGDALAAISAC